MVVVVVHPCWQSLGGCGTFLVDDHEAGHVDVVLLDATGEHLAAHVIALGLHRMLIDPTWEPPSASGVMDWDDLVPALLDTADERSTDPPPLTLAADHDGAVVLSSGSVDGRLCAPHGAATSPTARRCGPSPSPRRVTAGGGDPTC